MKINDTADTVSDVNRKHIELRPSSANASLRKT